MSLPIINHQLNTSVVLIIYRRPETTKAVVDILRKVKPTRIFVIADGPQIDRVDEVELCQETRKIIDTIDWECEVFRDYSDINLGLRERVSSGLNWVFEIVDEAIILEDDCCPDPSFFRFCSECLETYRYDTRVMMVCGTNLLDEWKSDIQSYCFSYHSNCWGWATWKRAWDYYDPDIKIWDNPEIKARIRDVISIDQVYQNYAKRFDDVKEERINSWALRWLCSRLSQSGLAIIPSVNLISNIGFGKQATNTSDIRNKRARLKLQSMKFPLIPPMGMARDKEFELTRFNTYKEKKTESLIRILKRSIKNSFSSRSKAQNS